MSDLLGIKGRVAIVTGAASGHGRAAAIALAGCGASVGLCDVNAAGLTETLQELPQPEKHLLLPCDLSQVSACESIVSQTLDRYGRLDILVNVAAVLQAREIGEVDEAHWSRTLDVNLKAVYFLSRAASRPMRAAKWGRIINYISGAGLTGGTSAVSVYAISKAGLLPLTQNFARAFARDNVLVNALSPSTLDTPLLRRNLAPEKAQELLAGALSAQPFGRFMEAADVAKSMLFLASEMCACVTGDLLHASGGCNVMHP